MRIGTPRITSHGDRVRWAAPLDGAPDLPEELWFDIASSHAGLVTDRSDPAVIGLLIPAMQRGLPIELEGPVTDELVHALTHGYQDVYSTVVPQLRIVPIEARTTVPAGPAASGVATGFSAGVDSFAVLAEHHFASVTPSLRLTHLTFFNVGAMGSGDSGREEFERHYASLTPVADRIGLPFVAVDSNLDDFYPGMLFVQSHGQRNLAAAALLQGGIGRYFMAGSFAYPDIGVHPSPTSAQADPIATPLLVNRQFHPISHGDRLSRVQKTLLISELPVARQSLTVCTGVAGDGRNCSTCRKCVRTALTLEIAGRLDAFGERFDVGAYHEVRGRFVDRVLTIDEPYHVEIRELAARLGYPLPSARSALARRALRGIRHRSTLIARGLRPGDRGQRAS